MRDFNALKNHPRANTKYPNMGLNGKPCKNPMYWCRLHEIWLSEIDVKNRQCKAKSTIDMIEKRQCSCLVKKSYTEFLRKMKGV